MWSLPTRVVAELVAPHGRRPFPNRVHALKLSFAKTPIPIRPCNLHPIRRRSRKAGRVLPCRKIKTHEIAAGREDRAVKPAAFRARVRKDAHRPVSIVCLRVPIHAQWVFIARYTLLGFAPVANGKLPAILL